MGKGEVGFAAAYFVQFLHELTTFDHPLILNWLDQRSRISHRQSFQGFHLPQLKLESGVWGIDFRISHPAGSRCRKGPNRVASQRLLQCPRCTEQGFVQDLTSHSKLKYFAHSDSRQSCKALQLARYGLNTAFDACYKGDE